MEDAELQALCERGQRELMETDYLQAVDTFTTAEAAAWELSAFDTLSRLYLPLQEARRQVRQRCGEGTVSLRNCSQSSHQILDPVQLLSQIAHGQLLVAAWESTAPAAQLRTLALQKHLYLETFLAATFPVLDGPPVIVVVPFAEDRLPPSHPRSLEGLCSVLPPYSLVCREDNLPIDAAQGTTHSYAAVMAMWEQLHTPFLQAADRETDPIRKMEAYRKTLRVDPACELAHQHLADVARSLARRH